MPQKKKKKTRNAIIELKDLRREKKKSRTVKTQRGKLDPRNNFPTNLRTKRILV